MYYPVIVVVCLVFWAIKNLLKQKKPYLVISDISKAKNFLYSSDLNSRVRSNRNLGFAFGISNPFTNSDSSYHRKFRKLIAKTIDLNDEGWEKVKNIAFEAVSKYSNFEKGGVVEIVPWIQRITLNVVLCGYLGIDVNVDEIINVSPGIINELWLKSKELDDEKKEKNETIIEFKNKLKNLFRKAVSETGGTSNVIKKISEIARKHFPNAFCSDVTNSSTDKADELESPLNILIPAYETMWRVILYAILEIKIRPSLKNEDVTKEIDIGELDKDVKTFLEKPKPSTLKKNESSPLLLYCIIQETLRLYPPTRHIHRVDEKNNRVDISVESIHRDPKNWGEDATLFKPKRFSPNEATKAYIPFSYGKLKCVAADKFAPTMAAILISAILDRVGDIILGQKEKESLLSYEKLPFKNSRLAFDKFEVTLTRKS